MFGLSQQLEFCNLCGEIMQVSESEGHDFHAETTVDGQTVSTRVRSI